MKKRYIRPIFLLFALLCAVGCSDNDSNNIKDSAETASGTAVNQTETAVPGDGRPVLGLPDTDFDGAEYRISCYQESDADSLYVDATVGEAVNDAVYARAAALTETYNFQYVIDMATDYTLQTDNVRKIALSGDDAYELVVGHVVTTCNNAIDGVFLDLWEVPHLDFTKPWWSSQSVDQMTVYDKMYTICSAINYQQLATSSVLFFNKEILAANDIETPYEAVRNGTWTLDQLITDTKGLYRDLNGDSTRDLSDQYGFVVYPGVNTVLTCCGIPILAATEDGGRTIDVMSDKTVTVVEKLYDWYYESGDVMLGDYETTKEDYTVGIFLKDHTAYTYGNLSLAVMYLRDSELSYGIVPFPKYDEEQAEYSVATTPSLLSIPISCGNVDFAGFVFEAMTYYGYYDVAPAYYETTLQGKVADSPDDVEMLSIINDKLNVSFAYCYDNWQGFAHLLGSRMGFTKTRGSKDVASIYEKYKKNAEARLETVLEGFMEN